jgi:hypothetical protein
MQFKMVNFFFERSLFVHFFETPIFLVIIYEIKHYLLLMLYQMNFFKFTCLHTSWNKTYYHECD